MFSLFILKKKNEKVCSEKSTKGVAGQTFDKISMGKNHRLNQLPRTP